MPVDEQIFVAGTAAVPLVYEVANSTELIPLAVRATFDGTGAGSAFLPAVEIVSDGGIIVATCPCYTEVAAGSTASVTFWPGANEESSASATLLEQSAVISTNATVTLVAAVASHRICVTSVGLMSDGFASVSFTAGAAKTGALPLAPNTGFVLGPKPSGRYWFMGDSGSALQIVLSAPANIGGVLDFEIV